jgi:hypothetical protein
MKADWQLTNRVTICDVVGKPSGVVTFLFTDVGGSTRRWESDAESMRRALAAHDEVMRGIRVAAFCRRCRDCRATRTRPACSDGHCDR